MKTWKYLGVLSLAVLIFTVGCGKRSEGERPTIAVATLMSHPALDQARAGMLEELEAFGWKAGEDFELVERNANSQTGVVPTIAQEMAAMNADVTVAITTPVAQALRRVVEGPLVFVAVTDPVGAGIVPSIEEPVESVTGTADAWPYREQLALIREILPEATRLGVMFNPGEAASQYGIRRIRAEAPDLGFELVEAGVNSVNEVRPVAENLADGVDAILLSSDNTVIAGVVGAVRAAIELQVPLFVGDSGTVAKGGVAAVSVGYHELGRDTGKLVAKLLAGERYLPVVVGRGTDTYVNLEAAERMGVEIPQAVIDRAMGVYRELVD